MSRSGSSQIPVAERFWQKVDRRGSDECWPWQAAISSEGYGRIKSNRRQTNAHRVAYELAVGPIPLGMEIDHLCRNRLCVNPAHLEPVTTRTNLLRGNGAPARNARKTHCKRGHEFTSENAAEKNGRRTCQECNRLRLRAKRDGVPFR